MSEAASTSPPVSVVSEPPRPRNPAKPLLHGGVDLSRFIVTHILGTVFPVAAGFIFYGWRAIGTIAVVLSSAAIALFVWRRIGRRGSRLRYDHGLWLALLLSLTLPPHLLTMGGMSFEGAPALFPILPAAGVALVILIWLLGGTSSGRIHPVLVTHLLLYVFFQQMLVPTFTLKREHIVTGDVLDATPINPADYVKQPWMTRQSVDARDALRAEPASNRLQSFTSGREAPERSWFDLRGLVRDRMPPLEDLIVGGQPGAIGAGSAIAVIIGGLFLLYRGLIDYRVPLIICGTCMAALLVLPVPVVITENARAWHWLIGRDPAVGWALAVTFANYEMMASPLLFTAFYLATSPAVRPMTRRARTIYAVLIGVGTAAIQLYVSVSIGPYLALLAVSLLTPTLDKLFRPRTLV